MPGAGRQGPSPPQLPLYLSLGYFCLLGQGAGQEKAESPPVLFIRPSGNAPDEARGKKRRVRLCGALLARRGLWETLVLVMQMLPMAQRAWASGCNPSALPGRLGDTGHTSQLPFL